MKKLSDPMKLWIRKAFAASEAHDRVQSQALADMFKKPSVSILDLITKRSNSKEAFNVEEK